MYIMHVQADMMDVGRIGAEGAGVGFLVLILFFCLGSSSRLSYSIVVIVICRDSIFPSWILWPNARIVMVHIVLCQPPLATCTSYSAYQLRL